MSMALGSEREGAKIQKRLLSTVEAARLLGLQPSTLEVWRCRGGGGPRYTRIGNNRGAIRYDIRDLDAYIEAGKTVCEER